MNIIVLFVVTIFDNKRRSHHIISAELPLRWSGVKCKTIMDVSSQLAGCLLVLVLNKAVIGQECGACCKVLSKK